MKIFRYLILFSCLATACTSRTESEKEVVTVSILPLKYFVDELTGGKYEVRVIVPPGSSAETYEPTPTQMKDVSRSVAYFHTGLIDFETALEKGLRNNIHTLRIVDLSEGIALLEGECGHDHHHEGLSYHHGIDPHIWMTPKNMKTIVYRMSTVLSELVPENSTEYDKPLESIIHKLDSTDLNIRTSLSGTRHRSFMIYHPFLGYYADEYGLTQLPIELDGKEPSASHMKQLVNQARELGLTHIFYQEQLSQAAVEAIAREVQLTRQALDPLAYDWFENMARITTVLKNSMQ